MKTSYNTAKPLSFLRTWYTMCSETCTTVYALDSMYNTIMHKYLQCTNFLYDKFMLCIANNEYCIGDRLAGFFILNMYTYITALICAICNMHQTKTSHVTFVHFQLATCISMDYVTNTLH